MDSVFFAQYWLAQGCNLLEWNIGGSIDGVSDHTDWLAGVLSKKTLPIIC